MSEPTPSIATATATVAVAALPVFNALPFFGDHGLVIGAAVAAAIIKTGMQGTATMWQTLRLALSILAISLFMTGTFAFVLSRFVDWPSQVVLPIVSFLLGLAYGEWGAIFNKLVDWVFSILPARKGDLP